MKHTIEVEWEQVDAIIRKELRVILNDMEEALERLDADKSRIVIFDHDKAKERAMIKEHIQAFRTTLAYWGGDWIIDSVD